VRYARWRGTSGVFRCEGTAKGKGGLLRRPMTDAERRGSPDATVVSLLLPPHPGLRYHLIEFLFRTGNLYAIRHVQRHPEPPLGHEGQRSGLCSSARPSDSKWSDLFADGLPMHAREKGDGGVDGQGSNLSFIQYPSSETYPQAS